MCALFTERTTTDGHRCSRCKTVAGHGDCRGGCCGAVRWDDVGWATRGGGDGASGRTIRGCGGGEVDAGVGGCANGALPAGVAAAGGGGEMAFWRYGSMSFACGAGEGAGGSEGFLWAYYGYDGCCETSGWGGLGVAVIAPTLDGMIRCDDAAGVRSCSLSHVRVIDA